MALDQYKCPCCGAPLVFSPETQKLQCESCNNEYELDDIKALESDECVDNQEEIIWDEKDGEAAKKTDDGKYICPSCGALVDADETKVSTICPYCDNVIVLKKASDGEFRPDFMIPFKVKGDQAQKLLEQFCEGKRLLPKSFKNKSYLKNLKGYYVPYWLYDCDSYADMTYKTTVHRMWSDSNYDYTETSYFLVKRKGDMSFYHVPVDGSTRMEDETTESVEPFDYSELKDYKEAYLVGYDTDRYDVKAETARSRATERIYRSAEDQILQTVIGYDSILPVKRNLSASDGKVQYALLPVWLFETVYEGKNYQFAINGQTGKLVGELPVDKGAYRRYFIQFSLIGTAVLYGLLALFGGLL